MAQKIQTPIPGTLLRNEFGLRGRVELQLGEEIIPVVNVADLARGAGLPLRRMVSGAFSQAPVAGEYGIIQMICPPNMRAQLQKIYLRASATSTVRVHYGNALAAGANLMNVRFSDARLTVPDFINPSIFPTYGTAAAGLGANFEYSRKLVNANEDYELDLSHIVLGAADNTSYSYLEFALADANVGFYGTLVWQEHPGE